VTVDLLETVERRVIPRLHASFKKTLREPAHPLIPVDATHRLDVPEFADLMLGGTVEGACARIDLSRAAGRSLESIYLHLLAPTASHLRDLWSDDLCGFADVTFAFCALQSVIRHYAPAFCAEAMRPANGSRILLLGPSGANDEVLAPLVGLMILSQFFRREGWDTAVDHDLTSERFRQTIGEWFDMVEVVAVNDRQLDAIAAGIRAIRRGSPNPSLGIVVCGQVFCDRPEYIGLVGADLMASDPLTSVSQATAFSKRLTPQRCFA
jgi:hypothetical protein